MYDSDGFHWVAFWISFRVVFCVHVLEMYAKNIIEAFYLYPTIRFSYFPQLTWTAADQQLAIDMFNAQFDPDFELDPIATRFWKSLLPALSFLVILQTVTGISALYKKKISKEAYAILWICNWLICIGYGIFFFGESCFYNNHHYLYLILWFIYCITNSFVDVGSQWSLPSSNMLFLLRFQVAIVYIFAGIAKFSSFDWKYYFQPIKIWFWTGTAFRRSFLWRFFESDNVPEILQTFFPDMRVVGNTLVFLSPSSLWIVENMSMIVSWGGLLLDLFGGIVLLFNTRFNKFILVGFWLFHLMNSAIFDIGTFPWMMLGTTFLWWIPKLSSFISTTNFPKKRVILPTQSYLRGLVTIRTFVVCLFVVGQILVPMRYMTITDDVNWTNDGHYFAWRMMLNEEQELIRWNVVDNSTSPPTIYQMSSLSYDETALRIVPHQRLQMKQDPKKIQQFTREYIVPSIIRGFSTTMGNISVHVDCWRSVNGDPFQRWILPDLDLIYAPLRIDNFASHSDWLLPRIPLDPSTKATIDHYRQTWLKNSYEAVFFVDSFDQEWEGNFLPFATDFRLFVVLGEVFFFTEDSDWGTSLNEDSKSVRVPFAQRHFIATLSPYSVWGYAFKSPTMSFLQASQMM